uniref:Uncharacterized protein n=1 Tax=Trichogramma kaykai TaxID=54128 RepID=A0ABD2X7Y1_9HYME
MMLSDYDDVSDSENERAVQGDSDSEVSSLEKFMSLLQKVHWDIENERHEFLRQLEPLYRNWKGQYPDLREIFSPEGIEALLVEDMEIENLQIWRKYSFAHFVARTGYKDKPKVDQDGKPILRRTTPVHYLGCSEYNNWFTVRDLFKIYNSFDLNYTDDYGVTHFHLACLSKSDDVVEKFLELGQNPNCPLPETGNTPLHLALDANRQRTVELLLRNGADPNLPDSEGSTPLHSICKECDDKDLVGFFFKIIDDIQQTVKIDAVDKLGRTPLQLAVANLLPNVVDVLLDNNADLSSFVFPTSSYFGDRFDPNDYRGHFKMRLASDALIIVERLEKRGYELDLSGAITIKQFFDKYRLFEKPSDLDTSWYDDEEFVIESKTIMLKPSLSLYDLIRLRPKEASKLVTYSDYYKFAHSYKLYELSDRHIEACTEHLCEKLSREFFRQWALDPFLELMRYRLPILCCELIIEKLMNEDLWHIYLATADQRS